MLHNHSPWLEELDKKRKFETLRSDLKTDVLIVGGGIAGMVSAYYILGSTEFDVVLVEGNRIAHGATGHNAGQVVFEFEKPFSEIVFDHGFKQTIDGLKEVLNAWNLIESIIIETGMDIPFQIFKGFDGCATVKELIRYMEDAQILKHGGLKFEKVIVANTPEILKQIPREYKDVYEVWDHQDILSKLETDNPKYIGLTSSRRGCINSALFTEKLAQFLSKEYTKRFRMYENTLINRLDLFASGVEAFGKLSKIEASKVLLCTNGFEYIHINNMSGDEIDKNIHEEITGVVGYMAGYFDKSESKPKAQSFYEDKTYDNLETYYYLTRRNLKNNKDLICIGGPEKLLDEKQSYSEDKYDFPEYRLQEMEKFLAKNYRPLKNKEIKFRYHWHGLMGYTKGGVRIVGVERRNKNLLYNLGCNGVGILPSISGGYRIGKILSGRKLQKSIFDPR